MLKDEPVFNLDKLTYAGSMENLSRVLDDPRHVFVRGNIGDRTLLDILLAQLSIAAETFISTRLSGVSLDINYISKTYVTLTRGIAQMVSAAIQKYRNLRNFTRAERMCLY